MHEHKLLIDETRANELIHRPYIEYNSFSLVFITINHIIMLHRLLMRTILWDYIEYVLFSCKYLISAKELPEFCFTSFNSWNGFLSDTLTGIQSLFITRFSIDNLTFFNRKTLRVNFFSNIWEKNGYTLNLKKKRIPNAMTFTYIFYQNFSRDTYICSNHLILTRYSGNILTSLTNLTLLINV